MRAALYTPHFLLPILAPKLASAYASEMSRLGEPQAFSENYLRRAGNRLSLERDAVRAFGRTEWIKSGADRIKWATQDTRAALAKPEVGLVENASFFSGAADFSAGIYARAFLLKRAEGGWRHFEVSENAEPSQAEVLQMAVQECLMERSGIAVDASILLVASAANLAGDGAERSSRPEFSERSVTVAVQAVKEQAAEIIRAAEAVLPSPVADAQPEKVVSVASLVGGKERYDVIRRLVAVGIVDLKRVPEGFPGLTDLQREQIHAARSGEEFVHYDIQGLREVFARRVGPVHYLDFETDEQGKTPGEISIPFQFSDHILEESGSITHASFVHGGVGDPREQFAECLVHAVGAVGTIVVYHKDFEIGRIRETAVYLRGIGKNELADKLDALIPRVDDQLEYVKKFVSHSGFNGSNSLKSTYPALVKNPRTRYADLVIHNGAEAAAAIAKIRDPNVASEEKAALTEALIAYCALDTYAMIEIDDVLRRAVGLAPILAREG